MVSMASKMTCSSEDALSSVDEDSDDDLAGDTGSMSCVLSDGNCNCNDLACSSNVQQNIVSDSVHPAVTADKEILRELL